MRRTYLLSGGPQNSSSANVRAASPAGGPAGVAAERGSEALELTAKARCEERSEAALQPERRRMLAGEQRSEIRPAEREHGGGLGRAHAHRVPSAVEQRDLADHLSRA